MRQFFRCLEGAAKEKLRERKFALWHAWNAANYANARKLPDLALELRKLDPIENRVMSPQAQRSAILNMANAMGAKVTYRKKGEAIQ